MRFDPGVNGAGDNGERERPAQPRNERTRNQYAQPDTNCRQNQQSNQRQMFPAVRCVFSLLVVCPVAVDQAASERILKWPFARPVENFVLRGMFGSKQSGVL